MVRTFTTKRMPIEASSIAVAKLNCKQDVGERERESERETETETATERLRPREREREREREDIVFFTEN